MRLPPGFAAGLEIGASVAVEGVCLTVTSHPAPDAATVDVMQQSLALTTLADLAVGSRVNVERAAKDGAEIGGQRSAPGAVRQGTSAAIHDGVGLVVGGRWQPRGRAQEPGFRAGAVPRCAATLARDPRVWRRRSRTPALAQRSRPDTALA